MSISRQNLSVVIVTFKSDLVIDDCIKSIPEEVKIIVIDNSNDIEFKENLEKRYSNVECVLSSSNIGMGSGNNLGLKYVKTDFAIILNPDVVLYENTIEEIINASKSVSSFTILAPISSDLDNPNYKLDEKILHDKNTELPFKVKSIDGYAMVLNLKELNNLENFKKKSYFDENFFMYLENDDFCKRVGDNNGKIFIVPRSKIKHLGGKAANTRYHNEIELSRNWHWMWSKFYFNKKHKGYFVACLKVLNNLISAKLKFLYYLITFNIEKRKIYQMRLLGLLSAMLGKKSFYRPKI